MRRLAAALGLAGHVSRSGAWCVPLTREVARDLRARLEGLVAVRRVRPYPSGALADMEALELEVPEGRLRYLLGGRRAALHRVLEVHGAAALDELDAGHILDPPTHELIDRHTAAMLHARDEPERVARAWLDDERWPPTAPNAAFEVAGPPDTFQASAPFPDEIRDGCPALYSVQRSAAAVASILDRGMVPRRWLALEDGDVGGSSSSGNSDLIGGGACFVFARLVLHRRAPLPIEPGFDYALLFDIDAFATVDRFVLGHDRFGSLHALTSALSDGELARRIRSKSLAFDHEVLFTVGIPASAVQLVICRNQAARDRLLALAPRAPVVIDETLEPAAHLGP